MFKPIQFLLFVVAAIALSGCFPVLSEGQVSRPAMPGGPTIEPTVKVAAMVTQTKTPWLTPTPAPSATAYVEFEKPTPTAITLDGMGLAVATFTDEFAGFAIDYPADWNLNALDPAIAQQSIVYTTSIRSPFPTTGPKQQEGFPPGTAGIDVTILAGDKSLEQAIAEYKENMKNDEVPPTVLSEEEWVLPSGEKALVLMLETRIGRAANMITVINGRPIYVVGMGELAFFEPIAKSIRPLE